MARIWLLLVLTPVSCLLQTDEGRLRAPFLTETFCVEVAGGAPGAVRRTRGSGVPGASPAWGSGCRSGTLGPGARHRWDTGAGWRGRPLSSDCHRRLGGRRAWETMVRGELCPRHVHTLQSQPPDA